MVSSLKQRSSDEPPPKQYVRHPYLQNELRGGE